MSKHFDYIRQLPCIICGNDIQTEVCHVRFADARAAKPITGMSIKSADHFVVPMCGPHHAMQHHRGDERAFWARYGIDVIMAALSLWSCSGDHEAGVKICKYWSEPGRGT